MIILINLGPLLTTLCHQNDLSNKICHVSKNKKDTTQEKCARTNNGKVTLVDNCNLYVIESRMTQISLKLLRFARTPNIFKPSMIYSETAFKGKFHCK